MKPIDILYTPLMATPGKPMFAMPQHLQDLIVSSAEHYKDSAIYWNPKIYSSTDK